ncbi:MULTISPECIES: hypothetical protein [Streptococcus]|uniref:Uncharacterized protein n=1 Tax=Streptococcus suis TaxID=1307 RepID=A0A0Z8DD96_STRSU|nr:MULTISPECIES: hypothetical protein [Streptococcus]ATH76005.1 hypothetical protein CG712_09570 [Streptococcus thermophilus]MDN2996993.1 hypothetical protein [Streptococcus suis]MDW8681511.1 hypothetical protein [Streptococcus suis]MDW8735426.1 hypothetical protein [Streptococcus suis]UUM56661.1 hypothetical protein NQZ93_05065 [Streptococcus suis]
MSKFVKEMIYLKEDRIILSLEKEEYDVTDHLTELVDELAKLKTR